MADKEREVMNSEESTLTPENQEPRDTQTGEGGTPTPWWEQYQVPDDVKGIVKNYNTPEEFFKAHKQLLGEFTQRSQELKALKEELEAANFWKQIMGEGEDETSPPITQPETSGEETPVPQTPQSAQIPEPIIERMAGMQLNMERMELMQKYPDFEEKLPMVIEILKTRRDLLYGENPLKTAYFLAKGIETAKRPPNPPNLETPSKGTEPTKGEEKSPFEKMIDEVLMGG